MRHIIRDHAIDIPLPIEMAFPLFTPAGEMAWIDEWRPDFIHPPDGETAAGMVFRTGSGAEETLWSCFLHDPVSYRIAYARVTPASRFAHVHVSCVEIDTGSTRVFVRYEITALNVAGEEFIEKTTENSFQASIEGWKGLIEAAQETGRIRASSSARTSPPIPAPKDPED